MHKQKLEAAKKLFFILLGIDMLVTAIVLISYIWVVGILKDVDSGVIVADASLISTVGFWDNFAKVMFLTLIGVGVGLVKWLNACYTYAKETLRTSGFKQDSWTAFGWILPIINLFKPYQVINEIYKVGGLGYQNTEDWKKESWSGLLLTWWIFYAITHLIGTIATKYILKQAIRVDATMQQSISSIELSSIFCVFSIIVAGLWFLVASSLTRRLLERNAVVYAVQTPTNANFGAVNIPIATPLQSAQLSRISINPGPPNQPIQANFAASTASTSVTSDDLWAQALTEYDSSSRNHGLWARLFSEAQGNEAAVKANYMRIRVDELQKMMLVEKVNPFEDKSYEQSEANNNFVVNERVVIIGERDFWVQFPWFVMKWLPWLCIILALIGAMIFFGNRSSGTNQSARAEIPLLNPAPPTASSPNLNQTIDHGATSKEVQRQAQAAAKATTTEIPKFTNYPVQIYSGTYAKVELTKQDSEFKTRLRDSFQSPINFAGEYTLTLWGCGMDCVMGAAVSKRTGMVVWLPGTVCCWKGGGNNIEYRSNSKLIVLGGLINEEGKHAAHFYELKNDVFVPILSTPADGQLAVPAGAFNITVKYPPDPNDPNSPENYFSYDNLTRRNLAERSAYYHKWMKAHANTYLTDMGKKQYEQEFRRKGPDNLFGIQE